jgi:hypothetical protein
LEDGKEANGLVWDLKETNARRSEIKKKKVDLRNGLFE